MTGKIKIIIDAELIDIVVTYPPSTDYLTLPPFPIFKCGVCGGRIEGKRG